MQWIVSAADIIYRGRGLAALAEYLNELEKISIMPDQIEIDGVKIL